MFRVLAIDGGGIRGIIPATVLTALEALSGRRIYELFDLLAGTSTGGILALSLTCPQSDGRPRTAEAVRELYLNRGSNIFPLGGVPMVGLPRKSPIFGTRTPLPPNATAAERIKHFMGYQNVAKVGSPLGGNTGQGNARYPAGPLEHELQDQLGETMMSRALRPVAVVSCDLDRGIPLVFRGGGLPQGELGDTQMRHVARATSAGPTYFPPLQYKDALGVVHVCVDGGLVANDPAFVAYGESMSLLRALGRNDDVVLVSLGTGAPDAKPPEANDVAQLVDTRTWIQLAPSLLRAMMSSPAELMREQMQQVLGDRYVRLQTPLLFGAEHGMDNVLPTNAAALLRTGEDLVARSRPLLEQLSRILAR
jgi:patatin-like phospholipase/acyl hydrolase